MASHPHLILPDAPPAKRFTSPSKVIDDGIARPPRDRAQHAAYLTARLTQAQAQAGQLIEQQQALGFGDGAGVYLTFESEPGFELKFESLDVTRSGVELCNVQTTDRTRATVYVPDGKIELFLRRITAYRDEMTNPRFEGGASRPKNQDLAESISDIHIAALEALWAEPDLPFPQSTTPITWEVWLRKSPAVDYLARLKEHSAVLGLSIDSSAIKFVDRTVVLVKATTSDLARSAEIIGMIAEIRSPKTTSAFFVEMKAVDQADWIDDLLARTTPPPQNAPFVCVLDTGITHGNPLLSLAASGADMHAYKPAWGSHDWKDHGTPMGGLALWGDLTTSLESSDPLMLTHFLESVKIVHQTHATEPELYGAVTEESTYRVEVIPGRKRVFCMAVTATDSRDRGRPTSWSAKIDALAAGTVDETSRLYVLSAGNTDPAERRNYPNSNLTDSIHDPAQSWNALTVGGYTEKSIVDTTKYPGWSPLAPQGDMSPCSCTSLTWGKWPIKPEIVMEAGNMAHNPAFEDPDYIDPGLQLLSTSRNFSINSALTTFGDTSAASALAARLAALVLAKYPNLSAETIRGLLVHSADWTQSMRARFTRRDGTVDYNSLLRCFGYGVPNERRLFSSLDNSLTLIAESELKPFFKDQTDGNRYKTREMRTHPLPWPIEALTDLGDTDIRMKVTLSYFVEPSPGMRGMIPKYGYQSHGLRFAVRKSLESENDFANRVNRFGRDEDYQSPGIADRGWRFGHAQRTFTSLGSIHSDEWRGKAVDLATRKHIAVYPTMGWWIKRPHLSHWDRKARYSLLVSIETPDVESNLYALIANEIGVPVEVET